jgi:hypothetical protein
MKVEETKKQIEVWRKNLKQAIIKGDLGYQIHCDEMIYVLKKKLNEQN